MLQSFISLPIRRIWLRWLFLIPEIKITIKRRRFQDIQTIQSNVTDILRGISETDFKHTLEGLAERYQKCIDLNGVYIE